MADGTGVWLYAVTDDRLAEGDLGGLAGVAGEAVRAVGSGGLTAVVGSVPLAVFGEEPLKRNLEDLSWLEATARAHDAVVSTVAQRGPAVPLRLATVYLDDARVRDLLDERQADFESALTLVTGRTEWGVKAYGDRQALADAVAEAQIAGSAKGSGTAYLLRRRAQLAAQESVERDAAARADEIHSRLLRQAAAGRRQPATDPALSGRRDWMVLNGTYLVDDDRADEFARAVEELRKEYRGIRLELTGPWPPYSFAGVERDTA
ncbi:GvpL/GvpF family gas vesicle protein [Rhodococcus ruber]|uniref:GvpL/GvpF family gas vesicle protein n=1 Tax=Rhodococcus TaxID=1827 RepID=UPI000E6B375D|nr:MULTISPECIES: GvpL/GvpF family gas vesicle protein [Rhodococcus]UQB72801.1 GvpL/GvpF family gas vesicle protein [Rhodococcus ruber]WML62689.1 GvpL/GvpF family gas vesicle protein [Rhodococcus sp. AH-ZY2]